MRWALIRTGTVIYRGSREEVMAIAERHGIVFHVGVELDDAGEPRGVIVEGRNWHADGTELPCRLSRGCVMIPEAMLPRRYRRIAA